MELSQIIDNIYHLPVQAKNKLMKSISYVEYPSGYRLYRENAKETRAYFMKKGLARAYSIANGHETTFWFGREGDFITPLLQWHRTGWNTDLSNFWRIASCMYLTWLP